MFNKRVTMYHKHFNNNKLYFGSHPGTIQAVFLSFFYYLVYPSYREAI